MSVDPDFIKKGMEIIKQAVIADNADELVQALSLYKQGLSYFMTGMKYMKNAKSKEAVREKIGQYMARAEQIKEAIDKKKEEKPKIVEGGGKGKKEDEKDSEAKKLQDALSSSIIRETPNVKWDDVAGLEQAKTLLKEAAILPIKFPALFTAERKPWKGILLYGPPGTGKSYLAKAVATETGASCFLSVSSSDLVSKYQGESERLVKNLFELARMNSPSIIFIDEVDSLCSTRGDGENEAGRRIKTEFLVQMQGVGKTNDGILVLGATNTPWELDPAIRRRFEKRVYIPLPDAQAREGIFKIAIGTTPHSCSSADWKSLAARTEGFSGSDISVLVRDALYEPVRTCQIATHFKKVPDASGNHDCLYEPCSPGDPAAIAMDLMSVPANQLKPIDVSMKHFEKALLNSKPSVGPEDLERLEKWTTQYGQDG